MDQDLKNFEQKLKLITEDFKSQTAGIRTNRPSAKMVEDIRVDYFGQKMPIKQLASISVVPPREIDISVWDKGVVGAIAKAIEVSGLGLTANIDGSLIRLNLPPMTDERRQEFTRLVKSIAEEHRIKIRAARDEVNKKAKALSDEDDKFKSLKKIQDFVDKANKEIEASLENKVKEINS